MHNYFHDHDCHNDGQTILPLQLPTPVGGRSVETRDLCGFKIYMSPHIKPVQVEVDPLQYKQHQLKSPSAELTMPTSEVHETFYDPSILVHGPVTPSFSSPHIQSKSLTVPVSLSVHLSVCLSLGRVTCSWIPESGN